MTKFTLPMIGNIVGTVVGLLAGAGLLYYLAPISWFDSFCIVSACILTGQLVGTTLGAVFGR